MRTPVTKIVSLLCLAVTCGFSQSHFTHTADTVIRHATTLASARDFWLAVPQNYDANDNADKKFSVYITAEQTALVNIQIGSQATVKQTVNAGATFSFELPRSIELRSSDTVEEKIVHVWSDDGEITVYFMSRNPFTSDGFMVLPRLLWGTEYVVASYSALLVNPQVDLPSEFCIIADQDNTVITINPSQDIRKTGKPSEVSHPKGTPFTVTLQRGESIQYQTVLDLAGTDLDLTRTVITATKPIGVIGASACPFIPADPYCDHICEMLLPVNKWGKTYYTIPFAGRKVGGDSFYVIASKDNQSIYRNGSLYATLNKYSSYFRPDISEASVWTSDAPFILVQYINSATYGGGTGNLGDPAMVEINPAEFGRKKIVTPFIQAANGQPQFKHYLNVLLPTDAVANTKFDGQPITQYASIKRLPIPGTTWEGIQLSSVANGVHELTSDSVLTAYAYGYSTDDSYAWGMLGPDAPIEIPNDTIPPSFTAVDSCNCSTISLSENANRIVEIRADSLKNLILSVDPAFQPPGKKNTFYELCGDPAVNGFAKVTALDSMGNSLTIQSSYKARLTRLEGSSTIEFTVEQGQKHCITIAITNLTEDTLNPQTAYFLGKGRYTFTSGGIDELQPLLPNESEIIMLCFIADSLSSIDTFVYSYDSCRLEYVILKATVTSSGGVDDLQAVSFHLLSSVASNRKIMLTWSSAVSSQLDLYDILGRLRFSKVLPSSVGSSTEEIYLAEAIESGSYIVRFSSGGYVESKVIHVIE